METITQTIDEFLAECPVGELRKSVKEGEWERVRWIAFNDNWTTEDAEQEVIKSHMITWTLAGQSEYIWHKDQKVALIFSKVK